MTGMLLSPDRGGGVARLRSLGLLFMLAVSTVAGESGSSTGLDPGFSTTIWQRSNRANRMRNCRVRLHPINPA